MHKVTLCTLYVYTVCVAHKAITINVSEFIYHLSGRLHAQVKECKCFNPEHWDMTHREIWCSL